MNDGNTAEMHSKDDNNGADGPQEPVIEQAPVPEAPTAIEVGAEDGATVKAAQTAIFNAQQKLGLKREQFMLDENACLDAIGKSRQSFEGVLLTLAEKHGVDLKAGQWIFMMDTMSFVPRKPQQ